MTYATGDGDQQFSPRIQADMDKLRIRQALQWWSYRQSRKLFWEAEKIRDTLLQESFIIRRGLDLLVKNNLTVQLSEIHAYLKKIDDFHQSLVNLSDRLCPTPIQHSLTLSIECLLETLLESSPYLYYQIDVPLSWQNESTEHNLLILRILEELFMIIIPEIIRPISIYITSIRQANPENLVIEITYPDISTLVFHSSLPELIYLQDSFQFLLPGKCNFYRNSLSFSCGLSW